MNSDSPVKILSKGKRILQPRSPANRKSENLKTGQNPGAQGNVAVTESITIKNKRLSAIRD
jgi:hypothetical protein